MKKIKNTCIIYGCSNFSHKYYGYDYNYRTSNKKYEIIQCNNCGLEQIFPQPDSLEQSNFYPKNYYSYIVGSEKSSLIGKIIKFLSPIFKNKKFELPDKIEKGKKFLDIGCGDGFNLKTLKDNGSEGILRGFEISNHSYFDNDIYYGKSIVDISFNEKFDYIWCNHTFEHVDNPIGFLKKVHSIMENDAVFVLTLPNVKSFMSKLFGKYATDRDIPRHLYGYSWNIEILLKREGFKIVDKSSKTQGNSSSSFFWRINDKIFYKRGIDIRNIFLIKNIVQVFFLVIDSICSLFRNTNQMSFILKKK